MHIAFHDARWNANVFGVSAIIEQQIFAQILVAAPAIEALKTRGGIGRHHALAHAKIVNVPTDGDDIARQFVPE